MSKEPNYHEFDTLPVWTSPIWKNVTGEDGVERRIVENESDPYKWSGKFAPPAIGERVLVAMNRIGHGRVVSYFAEYGWLGVKVLPEDPPEWYVEQNGRDCAGHCFGTEIKRNP